MSDTRPLEAPGSFYARATAAQGAGRFEEAVELLWQGAQRGDVGCMSLLGAQLMTGRGAPPDLPTGARLMLEAAARGGAYACFVASAVTAAGLLEPADWPRALDWLQRSAELGHGPGQAALKVLARRPGPVGSSPAAWRRLRERVDLEAWRSAPPARALSAEPWIQVAEGFIAPDVCDWIISRSRERLAPAMVFDTAAFRPVQDPGRSNSVAGFELAHTDLVVLLVRERLAAACGRPAAAMEAPQVFHYAVGQQFAPHFDFLEPDMAGHAEDFALRGQRSFTLLTYLNAGFEGGETGFPVLDLKFKGAKGDLLMFRNVDETGAPDRRTWHAGLPPTAGEKWLLSQWVRDRVVRG
jgi:hypothetical protein